MRFTLGAALILMAVAFLPADSGYFRINSGGRTVGVSGYELAPSGSGWDFSNWTVLKVGIGKAQKVLRFSSSARLDSLFHLMEYSLKLGDTVEIECRCDSAGVECRTVDISKPKDIKGFKLGAEKLKKPEKSRRSENFSRVDAAKDVFVLDNYMFGQWVPVARAIELKQGSVSYIRVLIPQLRRVAELRLGVGHIENYLARRVYRVDFSGEGFGGTLWIDSVSSQVIKIETQDYDVEFSDSCPDTAGISSMDIEIKKPASKIKFEGEIKNPLRVKKLVVQVNFVVEGQLLLDRKWQKFDGDVHGDTIVGEIEIDIDEYSGKKSANFDELRQIPDELGEFAREEADIPVSDHYIRGIAERFPADNVWRYVILANRWIADNIKHKAGQSDAAVAARTRMGDPLARARLLAAVLRSRGIPCRVVGGVYYFGGVWVPHYWDEVWLGKKVGWRPVDPSTGEDRNFSAIHITLFEKVGSVGAGSLKIKKVKWR